MTLFLFLVFVNCLQKYFIIAKLKNFSHKKKWIDKKKVLKLGVKTHGNHGLIKILCNMYVIYLLYLIRYII